MAHAQKPDFVFRAKRTSPFKSAGVASVQSTAGSRSVRISGSDAGYTVFRGSVKGTGYPLHSPVSLHFPSHASPRAVTFRLDSNVLYSRERSWPSQHKYKSLQLARTVGGIIQSFSQTWVAIILWSSSPAQCRSVSFITNPKPVSCTAVNTQNTTKSNCVISHAQNTTALQLNVFLIGIHWLIITSKQEVGFPPRRALSRSTEISLVTAFIFVIFFPPLIDVEFCRIECGAFTADETGLYYKLWRAMKAKITGS
jgi:hypothetical protein